MEGASQSEGSAAKRKCFGGDYVAAAARGRGSAPIRHRRAKDMDAFWVKILFLFMLGAFALGPNEKDPGHVRIKRGGNGTAMSSTNEECRADSRCRPCASFERGESFCLMTGFKRQISCLREGAVSRISFESCNSDSAYSATRYLIITGVVCLFSALLVHLRKKCIIREHAQRLQAMSNV